MRYNRAKHTYKGVTFIELIVVISIFGVISSVVLFRFSDYSANIDFQNTVSEVALKLKQAQNDSVNGKAPVIKTYCSILQMAPSFGWTPSYGLYLSPSHPKDFVYFFDDNSATVASNYLFEDAFAGGNPWANCPPQTTERQDIVTLTTGDTLAGICESVPAPTGSTNDCANPVNIQAASITFKRPFLDAHIKIQKAGAWSDITGVLYLVFKSASSQPQTQYMMISPVGQIVPNATP